MRIIVIGLLVALAFSGCLSWQSNCTDIVLPEMTTPPIVGNLRETDPTQPWDTLVLVDGVMARDTWNFTFLVTGTDWSAGLTNLTSTATEGGLQWVRVQPGTGAATGTLRATASSHAFDGCTTSQTAGYSLPLNAPRSGEVAHVGQGVHVLTAGFYENGTLFYTNMPSIDQGDWLRPDWYEWEGDAPLPVYIYDKDRTEEPAYWHGTTAGSPAGQPTNNLTAWNYFTTIPGFNHALKGLSTTTVRVAHLTPEEAYTRPGNEAHQLYGEPLVFYIKLLDVVDLPCAAQVPPSFCDAPPSTSQIEL